VEESDMALSEVSNILWRERQLLELLLFKLEEEQLVLAAGRTRWLNQATREVEMVLEEIKRMELERSMAVDDVATELGLPPGTSLRKLAETAPAPWSGLLEQHRKAFLTATQEILALAQLNRDLLTRGQRATRDALSWLGDAETEIYSATGSATVRTGPRLVNEAL
jgi:hypothetical protein